MVRKLIASLIMLIILMVTPLFSLAYAFLDSYLDPSFYTNEEVVEGIYDLLTSYTSVVISENIAESMGKEIIDETELESQLRSSFSKDELLVISKDVMQQIKQDPLPDFITIDTSTIKENLPEIEESLMLSYFDSMEPCTPEQESGMLESGEISEACIPSGYTQKDLEAEMETMMSADTFTNIPDKWKIDLLSIPEVTRNISETIIQSNTILKVLIVALYLIMVGIMGLVIFKPLNSVATWVGNAFFWGGLPLAAINPLIQEGLKAGMHNMIEVQGFDEQLATKTLELVSAILGFVTQNMMWQGIVLTTIGFTLFILGTFVIKEKNDNT